MSQKNDGDVMSKNYDIIIFSPIYGRFAVIRKWHSGRIVYKLFINNNLFLLTNLQHSFHTMALSKDTSFVKKLLIFAKQMLKSEKLRQSWSQKLCFLKLHMGVYLSTRFQVSKIILTSFRQGG